jgi:hypothetical protein
MTGVWSGPSAADAVLAVLAPVQGRFGVLANPAALGSASPGAQEQPGPRPGLRLLLFRKNSEKGGRDFRTADPETLGWSRPR